MDMNRMAGLVTSARPGQFRHLLAGGTAAEKRTVVDVINEIGGINSPVDWDRLGRLLDRLIRVGPSMKVWSRLLCLVRPDLYRTVAAPSVRKQLSKVLEMPQSDFQTREGYVKLLMLIHASPWFLSSEPKDKDEAKIWWRRTAFLDAIFYEQRATVGGMGTKEEGKGGYILKSAPTAFWKFVTETVFERSQRQTWNQG